MNIRIFVLVWLFLGFGAFPWSVVLAESCPDGKKSTRLFIEEFVDALDEDAENLKRFAELTKAQIPAQALTASAVSGSQEGETLVPGGDLFSVLGGSIQSGLIGEADGVLSVAFSPFLWKVLANSENWSDQEKYTDPTNEWLRRFAVEASFGGKGEALDSDGDGTAEEALVGDFSDIFSWEARFRLSSSGRDFREETNWNQIQEITKPSLRELSSLIATLHPVMLAALPEPCYSTEEFKQQLEVEAVRERIDGIKKRYEAERMKFDASVGAALEIIQRNVWSVVVGGTQREAKFGRDEFYAALRGTYPIKLGQDLSFNLRWKEVRSLDAAPDPTTWTLGAKWTSTILKGHFANGLVVNFAATWEYFEDVPEAEHDDILKVQGGLDIPIADGIKLPVTVIWANHEDLVQDADVVEGHFGISFDVSKLLKRPEA